MHKTAPSRPFFVSQNGLERSVPDYDINETHRFLHERQANYRIIFLRAMESFCFMCQKTVLDDIVVLNVLNILNVLNALNAV